MANKFTSDEYKEMLRAAGFEDSAINSEFGSMPGDSTNSRKTTSNLLERNFISQNGKAPISNLVKALEDGTYQDMMKMDVKSLKADEGISSFGSNSRYGYGLGMKGSIAASRIEHLKNIRQLPLQAWENSLNTIGIVTHAQKLQAQNGGFLSKAMNMSIPLGVAGFSISQMVSGEDPYDIMAQNASFAAGMSGWQVGKIAGGALTSQGSIAGRMIGMGLTGAAGFAVGMLATQAVFDTAQDLTSNKSKIAKTAKSMYTRSSIAGTENTNTSLTLRQRTLQQLSSYSDNGRGTLLGNEAMIMKNLM